MIKSKLNIFIKAVLLFAVCTTTLCACSVENLFDYYLNENYAGSVYADNISAHFIDVGQGDSIFIELPNHECMLIDAGIANKGEYIENYIISTGYDTIDYLIATHPHADHIGSMDYIVSNMDIGSIYMPKVSTTTKTYERLLEAVQEKGMKIKSARAGMSIVDEEDLNVDILAPVEIDEGELNNCSIIIKITYESDSYLFIGDAEKEELSTVTADMSADVLKVGHHGSRTSTTEEFLEEVNPEYAVISCGIDNDYGHPHEEAVSLLNEFNVEYYRTDLQGTITITSDGSRNYSVTTEK